MSDGQFTEKEIDGVKVGYLRTSGGVVGVLERYAVSLYYDNVFEKKIIVAENFIDFESKLGELVFMFKLRKNIGGK